MEMKENHYARFIVFSLCDNDFAHSLEKAVALIWESCQYAASVGSPWDKGRFQETAARLVSEFNRMHHAKDLPELAEKSKRYLEQSLRVDFKLHPPTEDHDGGSCAICTSTGYIWRF